MQSPEPDVTAVLPCCTRKLKTRINMDCIKMCPNNNKLWAFSYYQQHPSFSGGIQILHCQKFMNQQFNAFAEGDSYVEMGPIMHIEWLNRNPHSTEYYILAAARCDDGIICKYQEDDNKLTILQRVLLQKGVFCLYCDWRVLSQGNHIQAAAVVSTNQSSIFSFQVTIEGEAVEIGEIKEYNKHQYAVWACKINPYNQGQTMMVAGDEVDCLYLYNLNTQSLVSKNKTAHTQGICQLIWISSDRLLSGSFDGSIAELSTNNFSQTVRKYSLGGTIWRIIPSHAHSNHYLICNSSDKVFQVLKFGDQPQLEWNSGEEHVSLAYAADWGAGIVVTGSFYDQEIRLWTI